MSELSKAILKTFLVFVIVALLLDRAIAIFHLNKILFDSFLFDRQHPYNKLVQPISFVITMMTAAFSSYLGYLVAGRKNRDKKAWAVLCIFLNIWGAVLLGFLPKIEKAEIH